ncbi:DUF605-domain-containing protein [Xylona heveae TC161]|uniref:DUF605-domain-containing protein n=1 Tax=Xylona heveae (strain CBS 132557 / TC161) TaxID=1328760 RepID=A0A165JCS0_XYLHT|nr:DUF605-domain-containing protein [Xylona heveae TC161]KZF26062.1 DUF605-domain-containing protein [Xylona heveae TC161]
MANNIPQSLKAADISRFAHRAAQLEAVKPVVSYWCDYWIVNQILSKKLHNADSESLTYTTTLMDKLEQTKQANAGNDAITDDVAGQAYVEQFGLETFHRADNAMRADKATRQTADTFQAAATFLDLLQIWGPADPEMAAKSKFAKYHALRIAKAIKAGEDPNATNPAQEPAPEAEAPELDPNDPEVQLINGPSSTKPRQPSVVEIQDENERIEPKLAAQSVLDESLHPSRDASKPQTPVPGRQPSIQEIQDENERIEPRLAAESYLDESLHPSRDASKPQTPVPGPGPSVQEVQDENERIEPQLAAESYLDESLHPSEAASNAQSPSKGGNDTMDTSQDGYFPAVPTETAAPNLPSAPASKPGASAAPPFPEPPSGFSAAPPTSGRGPTSAPAPFPPARPADFDPTTVPAPKHGYAVPGAPSLSQPLAPQHIPPTSADYYRSYGSGPGAAAAQPAQSQTSASSGPETFIADEEAISNAQKHARWAISALNFEDVTTAVKELRVALKALGAR